MIQRMNIRLIHAKAVQNEMDESLFINRNCVVDAIIQARAYGLSITEYLKEYKKHIMRTVFFQKTKESRCMMSCDMHIKETIVHVHYVDLWYAA